MTTFDRLLIANDRCMELQLPFTPEVSQVVGRFCIQQNSILVVRDLPNKEKLVYLVLPP